MIIILSKRALELTTERVIEWLVYYKKKFIRINGDDILDESRFHIEVGSKVNKLYINGKTIVDLNEVSVVWFRRWNDRVFLNKYNNEEGNLSSIPYFFIENISFDQKALRSYIFSKFNDKPFISDPRKTVGLGKLINLDSAKSVGLKVPETMVCNSKCDLIKFISKQKKVITKDIENSYFVKIGNAYYANFTSLIEYSDLKIIPDNFALSCFQELIEKEYEIRIFYFFDELYSMAIFSQNDEKTNVDFRKYNLQKPNRNVPYILPTDITSKIKKLMRKLNLETGSIDMIKTRDGSFIFLEVNPVGQISMVSNPCNYNLDKIIAEKLISYEK